MKNNKLYQGLYQGYSESEIFTDEQDKMKILSMKEVEKEKIIAERVEKLNHKKERDKLLNENQDKKNENTKRKNSRDDYEYSDSEEPGELSENKNRSKRKKTINSGVGDGEDSELTLNNDDDKQIKKETPTITLEEIEKIRLKRDFFLKYYNYPQFNELIKGAFIRVNMSSTGKTSNMINNYSGYNLGEIEEILTNEKDAYKFEGNQCTKYVKLKTSNKYIKYNNISNSNILEQELKNWINEKLPIPTPEDIATIQKNIETIKNYKLKDEEYNNIINQNKKDRIRLKDPTLNVTEELDLAIEEYRYNKEKYEEETKKEEKDKYYKLMKEKEEIIKQLEKMKEERDRKAKMISENDIVAKINEEVRKKQKIDEKISLLSKKRKKEKNDSQHKIFKRVDCHPTTLFDSQNQNEKKEEKKEITREKTIEEKDKKKNKNNFCYSQKIKKFKDFISEKKELIDEMMNHEKVKKSDEEIELKEESEKQKNGDKEKNNNIIDMSLFFKLASINYDVYNKMIMNENKKNKTAPQVKIIGLDEYLNNYNQ